MIERMPGSKSAIARTTKLGTLRVGTFGAVLAEALAQDRRDLGHPEELGRRR